MHYPAQADYSESAPNIETAKEPKQKPLNATQLTREPPKRTRLNQAKS